MSVVDLRAAAQEAIDLLAERRQGSPARSPGHNARLVLEGALRAHPAPAIEAEPVAGMPPRIWAWAWEVDRHRGQWSEEQEIVGEGVEYIRDDLAHPSDAESLRAEVERLRHDIKMWQSTAKDRLIRAEKAEADLGWLKRSIFGSANYLPSLPTGCFAEMAQTTEAARKGALSRAEKAEAERDAALARVAEVEAERDAVFSAATGINLNGCKNLVGTMDGPLSPDQLADFVRDVIAKNAVALTPQPDAGMEALAERVIQTPRPDVALRHQIAAALRSRPVGEVKVKGLVDTHFGEMVAFDGAGDDLILVSVLTASGIRPKHFLLPHQLYTKNLPALEAEGEVVVTPVPRAGAHLNVTQSLARIRPTHDKGRGEDDQS